MGKISRIHRRRVLEKPEASGCKSETVQLVMIAIDCNRGPEIENKPSRGQEPSTNARGIKVIFTSFLEQN
jgi:hypothetical protein